MKMKICVATDKGGLEDIVSAVFGRCASFTFVEVEGKEIKNTEIVQNQFAGASGGAGIQASQFIANKGANVVIAGSYGPDAFSILSKAGIKVISTLGISVNDAVMKYLNGELQEISQATGHAYTGMHGGGMSCEGGMGGGSGRGQGGRRGRGKL